MRQLRRIFTVWLPAPLRDRRVARKIRASGIFDEAFYLDRYVDVREASHDPVLHYVCHGAAEGRDPHPLFDTNYYRRWNPDVIESGWNPLAHFVTHGWLEGRDPSPTCALAAQLERDPSLQALGVESLATLLEVARARGVADDPARKIQDSGLVDATFHVRRRPAVVEAPRDPARHHIDHRAIEGHDPHPLFDTSDYVARQAPVVARQAPVISVCRLHEAAAENSVRRGECSERSQGGVGDPVVVVISHICPSPPRQGNEYRVNRYLRWLEFRGYQTLFVCCPLPGEELDERDLAHAARELSNFIYCDRLGVVKVSLVGHLDEIVADLDGTQALPLSEDEAGCCATEVELSPGLAANELVFCPDVLVRVLLHIDSRLPESTSYIANYVLSTRYLPLLKVSRLKILDAIDVFSTMADKVSAFGVEDRLAISSEEERTLLLRADVVMAIQPVEARILAGLVPERRVIDVGVDFDTAPEENASLPQAGTAQRVVMVASSNPMNVKGLGDFLAYVWPLVLREHPTAELLVGGAVSEFVPEESPNVIALGYVDSLEDLYRGCRVVVNPTIAGTGLKIKTLECLAFWRPLVTWPTGVDGLTHELSKLCVVVTDLYEFYLEITKALSEPQGEAYCEDERSMIRYSLSGLHIYRELEEILAEFVSAGESSGASSARP